jgi:hypothetical protein
MQITDLGYLESISTSNSIRAGALVSVDAYASATGDSAFADVYTNAKVKEFKNGGSIGFGRGKAIAIGENPVAGVSVYGEGDSTNDKIIEKTKVHYFPNKDMVVAKGFVLVIDRP